MGKAYGRRVKDYIGVNPSKGTEAASLTRYNIIDNSIEATFNKKEREARWGTSLTRGTYNAGEAVDGTINVETTPQTILDIFSWFGFKQNDLNTKLWEWSDILNYLTIFTHLSDAQYYEVAKDCRLGSVKLSVAKASIIKAELNFSGVSMELVDESVTAIAAPIAIVTDVDNVLYGSDFSFNLGGDLTGDLISCDIQFENGLDLDDQDFSGNRKDIGNGDRAVTIDITMDFEKAKYMDLKNKDKMNTIGTNLAIKLGMLEFNFAKVSIDEVRKVFEGKNKVKASVKFKLLDNGGIPLTLTDTTV